MTKGNNLHTVNYPNKRFLQRTVIGFQCGNSQSVSEKYHFFFKCMLLQITHFCDYHLLLFAELLHLIILTFQNVK